MENTNWPEHDILLGETPEVLYEIGFHDGQYTGFTDNERARIKELEKRKKNAHDQNRLNIYAEIASLFPRYRAEFSVTEPSELLGNMPTLPETPSMRERVERFVWINIWRKRHAETLSEKLSDERTLRLSQIDKAIAETTRQLDSTGSRKRMDKPVDFVVFNNLFGSAQMALSEEYRIDVNGIFAVPPEGVMSDERLVEYQKNADYISLCFPCSFAEIQRWAEKNELINVLMSSELIAGTNPETPLTKDDKKATDNRIIRKGVPTVSLRDFVDDILRDELEGLNTLPTFYRLVEEYGLVVYDGVIDSNIVSFKDLLIALRHREQEADEAFDDTSFNFWKPFLRPSGNEVGYTVFRGDVARAYHHAGKPCFPWVDWLGNKVELEVEEHITIDNTWEFGLPTKPEDYQEAFKQDTWAWQEALCLLKGRLPDTCRLHQLPKYYPEETDLIFRALKSERITADSTTPKQWVDWARGKGWDITPLIEQCLPPDAVSDDKKEKLETVDVDHQKSEPSDKPEPTKLEKQQRAILSVIVIKKFEPLKIPDGKKGTIKTICEADYPLLFDGVTSFDRAWKDGIHKFWKMENHESYSRLGI